MLFTTNQTLGHLLQGLNSSNTVQLHLSQILYEQLKLYDKPGPKSQDMFLKIHLTKYSDYLSGIILKECSPYKTGNKDYFGLFCCRNKWLVSSSLLK